jgi:GntR family transcriptional regulator/MocR family aminotransferase
MAFWKASCLLTLHAYTQLAAEGYVLSRAGAGTYVSGAAIDSAPQGKPLGHPDASQPKLSSRSEALLHTTGTVRPHAPSSFPVGMPDLAAFPWPIWQRLLHRQQRHIQPEHLRYLKAGGHPALKAALTKYLRLSRGVVCTPEQILITSGMQQALWLVALATADAGDKVWMEDPGYNGAKAAWLAAGLDIVPVSIDAEGLHWEGIETAPKLIYVTPSHQYPLGAVMSLARRQALLREAVGRGAWIVEDDYDSEFRHDGRPLAALQGLDTTGRVIYLGTFSKVLFPGLRLGYLVAPLALVEPLRHLQSRLSREGSYPEQAAVADFINEGHFGAHLRRMRVIYARRQNKLRATLLAELGERMTGEGDDRISLLGGEAGMHLTLRLPATLCDIAVSNTLAQKDIHVTALSHYCHGQPPFPGLILGYSGLDDATLIFNAVQLGRALKSIIESGACKAPPQISPKA